MKKLAILIAAATAPAWAGVEGNDFDGDGKADLAVYHAAKGDWYIRNSRNGQLRTQNWGWNQSQPVAGDFDGDGKTDLCVYDGRGAKWFLLRSRDQASVTTSGWGSAEQDPLSGDFDGDNISDMALYHPPSGTWYVLQSSNGQRVKTVWGLSDTEPTPGDFDGDGKTDYAVYQRSSGTWYVVPSSTGIPYAQNWGWSEAEPVQADYDGDGKTDLAVYHPQAGRWFIRQSAKDNALRQVDSGWFNAQPMPADYDGDGKDDVAVYDPRNGNWLVLPSATGKAYLQNWGWSQAEAAASAYRVDDDGKYYDHAYGHDYDDDTFESTGKYPRTGTRVTVTTPAKPTTPTTGNGGNTAGSGDVALLANMKWYHGPKVVASAVTMDALSDVYYKSRYTMLWMTFGPAYSAEFNRLGIVQYVAEEGRYVGGMFDGVKFNNKAKTLSNINGGPPSSKDGNYLRPYVVDFKRKTGYFLFNENGTKVSKIVWVQ